MFMYIELYFNTKIKDFIDLSFKKLLKTTVQSFRFYSFYSTVFDLLYYNNRSKAATLPIIMKYSQKRVGSNP